MAGGYGGVEWGTDVGSGLNAEEYLWLMIDCLGSGVWSEASEVTGARVLSGWMLEVSTDVASCPRGENPLNHMAL